MQFYTIEILFSGNLMQNISLQIRIVVLYYMYIITAKHENDFASYTGGY